MMLERRRKRSGFTALALKYWFSAVAQRTRVFGLVLADSAGLLVASNLPKPEAEELAAVAPLLQRPTTVPSQVEVPMTIKPVMIGRTQLFLCVIGARDTRTSGASLAETGVHRILQCH